MGDRYEALRAAAEKALAANCEGWWSKSMMEMVIGDHLLTDAAADAAFIAAASPTTVLTLLSERDALLAERDEARAIVRSLVAMKEDFDRNHADAYYSFVKGCWDTWDAAAALLSPALPTKEPAA